MTNAGPFLTIVVANYNYGRYLAMALESVFSQSCKDYELIVVDGGSKDNSVDVIREHAGKELSVDGNWHQCEKLTWISEKDQGQSDAFNKGFSKAHGKFLTWLNADDLMLDDAIEMLKNAAAEYPGQEWFAAGSVHFNYDGRVVRCVRTRHLSKYALSCGIITLYSPSSFFTKRLYDSVGGMDLFFQYTMDTNLWARFYTLENKCFKILPGYVFGFRYHPLSKTAGGYFDEKSPEQREKEERQVAAERLKSSLLFKNLQKPNRLSLLLHIDWKTKICNFLDTRRYKGKMMNACVFNQKS